MTVPGINPGFISVCAMIDPLPGDAPVIPLVIVPIVQLKLAPDGMLDNIIFVIVWLQMVVGPDADRFGAFIIEIGATLLIT